jgi:hypothetical protein
MTLSGPGAASQTPTGGSPTVVTPKIKINQELRGVAVSQGFSKQTIIKAASEGGDKRTLDLILEHLKYSIQSEWTEGQLMLKILETYEDVDVPKPD